MDILKKCFKFIRKSAPRLAMALLVCALLTSSPLLVEPAQGQAVNMSTNVLFIIDSSGSMWEKVDGITKVEAGRKILDDVIAGLPVDAQLGLMSFGHRRKGDCKDIELITPIGGANAADIIKKAHALKPKGITPLADALMQAKEAFKGINSAKMIVLITDGGEECKGDPCAAARELALSGLVIRVNVIGLRLIDQKERGQLECIAKEGMGRYFDVTDKQSLYTALEDVKKEVAIAVTPPPPQSPPAPPATEPAVVPPPAPATEPAVAPPATQPSAIPAPVPAPVVLPDLPAPPPVPKVVNEVNILLLANGGHLAGTTDPKWEKVLSGNETAFIWTVTSDEPVFAFKDDKPQKIAKFQLEIPALQPSNVQRFELLASDDSPTGPWRSLGQFTARNFVGDTPYQEFKFAQTSARYIKFKLISNYGAPVQGWGSTQIYQMRMVDVPIIGNN